METTEKTLDERVVHILTTVRDQSEAAPTASLIAYRLNTVSSNVRPALERLVNAGIVRQVGPVEDGWLLTEGQTR